KHKIRHHVPFTSPLEPIYKRNNRALNHIEHNLGKKSEEQDDAHQYDSRYGKKPRNIGNVLPPGVLVPVEGVLHDFKHEQRADYESDQGRDTTYRKGLHSGDENEQFRPEARHKGHAYTCQSGDYEKGGGNRHCLGKSSQFGNNLRVSAVIDIADRRKEKGRHDAVGEHLENRPVYAVYRHSRKPQSNYPHV